MKKISAVLAVVAVFCLVVSMAFASETKKGVVKSIDEKAGSIVLTVDGKDETLTVDKGVDLKAVKTGSNVAVTLDGGVAKKIVAEKKARATAGY